MHFLPPTILLLACTLPFSLQADPGILISAGHGGHRMASSDGVTWTHHSFWGEPAHNQQDLKAIAYGNGTCIIVGGYSRSNILVSTNGIDWAQPEFNLGVLSGVLFRDERFLIFGEGGRVAESSDGLHWSPVGDARLRDFLTDESERLGVDPLKSNIRSWREANGIYVGVGDNSIIVSTRDFQDWHFAGRIEPHARLRVETDGRLFVVAGGTTLAWSRDAQEWHSVEIPLEGRDRITNLVHDGERFIVTAPRDRAWESSDGQNWVPIEGASFPDTIATLRPDLYYSFATYWKYTETLLLSTDQGRSWRPVDLPAPVGITCIIHAPGIPKFTGTEDLP